MPSEAPVKRPWGTIYTGRCGALFVGGEVVNLPHRHFPASLIFCLQGTFRARAQGDRTWQTYEGLLVAPNVEQQMDARGSTVVVLLIDPETEAYLRIAHWFEQERQVHALSADLCAILAEEANVVLRQPRFDPRALWERVIKPLEQPGGTGRHFDARILRVIERLKADRLTPPAAAALAAEVALSESRLIHLFSEQMGLPMRRYQLWLRVQAVIDALAEGDSMTEAALAAGFADAAHMSRTFRDMFGVPPSALLKPSRTVNVAFHALSETPREGTRGPSP